MATAIALPSLAVSRDERELIDYHLGRLAKYRPRNLLKGRYYDGRERVRDLGISIPPKLRSLELVVGWPATAVDVLDERLDWLGWDDENDPFGLVEVYEANALDVDSGLAHLDALIYGTSFVVVGAGYDGEPSPLITVESPLNVTGEFDGRTRRLSSALSIDERVDGNASVVTLYTPDYDVTARNIGGVWRVVDTDARPGRDQHNLGRVRVARHVNRPRASRLGGRSEISRPVRAYTDMAARTLLGMEVNREFFSAPQRYALGVDESSFADKDGNVKTGWEVIMGQMLALPRDEDGELPTVGQFPSSTPQPYLEQVHGLAQLLSAEAAIPADYLGFETKNPPSADAIRAMEARLVKRAERRQAAFGRAWREVGALALMIREGRRDVPAEYTRMALKWRDPATPTRSALADEITKYVGANILPAESVVVLDRIGLSRSEKAQVEADRRRARLQQAVQGLTATASAPSDDEPEAANGDNDE